MVKRNSSFTSASKLSRKLAFMKSERNRSKAAGFTLIELLVVIAIIGILSSVVLASLSTARSKGTDAKVKSNLSGLRVAAEIYYDNNQSYGTASSACNTSMFADAGITQYLSGIPNATCRTDGTNYAVSAPLTGVTDVNADNWCVDSRGNSKAIANPLGAGVYTCP